jgi:hypothetical protein
MLMLHLKISLSYWMAALLAAVALTGCAMSDDKMASFLVAPGKYQLYTCPELIAQAKANGKRRRELEKLMAKAGQESSGRLVSTLAYRPDYLSAQGEWKDLREAAVAGNCDVAALESAAAGTGEADDDGAGIAGSGKGPTR